MKKRKAGIKEGANRAFYFGGYLGKFCKRGDIGKQNSYKTERIMWEVLPGRGNGQYKGPKESIVSEVQGKKQSQCCKGNEPDGN